MNRRDFIKQCIKWPAGLTAAILVNQWASGLSASEQPGEMVTHVAGAPYQIGFETPAHTVFHRGQALRAVYEPRNAYDPQAVALYDGSYKVGYVPRKNNSMIRDAFEQGHRVQVTVLDVDSDNPWEEIKIRLHW